MNELFGHVGALGWVFTKATLLFLTAIIGLRLAERRTLSDSSAIDFVLAVGIGSIIGRVPNASDTSYLEGAATLLAILATHAVLSRLRRFKTFQSAIDHPPSLLVVDGTIAEGELRRSGLTKADLFAMLRQHDAQDLEDVRYVVFERRGNVSVLRKADESKNGGVRVFEALD